MNSSPGEQSRRKQKFWQIAGITAIVLYLVFHIFVFSENPVFSGDNLTLIAMAILAYVIGTRLRNLGKPNHTLIPDWYSPRNRVEKSLLIAIVLVPFVFLLTLIALMISGANNSIFLPAILALFFVSFASLLGIPNLVTLFFTISFQWENLPEEKQFWYNRLRSARLWPVISIVGISVLLILQVAIVSTSPEARLLRIFGYTERFGFDPLRFSIAFLFVIIPAALIAGSIWQFLSLEKKLIQMKMLIDAEKEYAPTEETP